MPVETRTRVRDEQEWSAPGWLRSVGATAVVVAMVAVVTFLANAAFWSIAIGDALTGWLTAAGALLITLGSAPVAYRIGRHRVFLASPLLVPVLAAILFVLDGS